jgi:Secretion system C-terminal sorting domain/Beta-propeller repeat
MKYTLKIFYLALILRTLSPIKTDAQIFDWAKGITGNVTSYGISVDNNGNSYITGGFFGSATFNNIQLTALNGRDFFIAKYDANGNCIWAKQAVVNKNSLAFGNGITADKSGNTYIIGQFEGSAAFGNNNLIAVNDSLSIFIVKYDSGGNCLWAKQAGNKVTGNGISIDANGNSYITGSFRDTAKFGNTTIITTDSGSVYVSKYDANGNCLWVTKDNGDIHTWAQGFGIAAEPNGENIITGEFSGNVSFGNIQLTAPYYPFNDKYNVFIVKYDSSGNCLWAKQSNGTGYFDIAFGEGIDAKSNSYITGQFSDTINFNNIQMISSGDRNAFVAKYDSSGNCIWAKHNHGNSNSNGIAVDANGDNFITGQFFGKDTIGTTQLNSGDSSNFFIARYDINGNNIWAEQSVIVDSNTIARGLGIAADASGNCYVTGAFIGTLSLGNNIISGSVFIAKISNNYLGVANRQSEILNIFKLSQNYPNPFNPSTTINYSIPKESFVTIKVYDILGRMVNTLVNEQKAAGNYSVQFNGMNLSSGIYFYSMQAGDFVQTKKLVLMK